MKRPVCKTTLTRYSGARPSAGYTMMEILVATALMLTIMLGVAWVFGMVGETISDSRSTLEMTGQLRSVAARLKQELDGVTVTMLPPRDPASNEGYFEITEGAIGPVIPRQVGGEPYGVARNLDRQRAVTAADPIPYEVDTTVGDTDDILMFTTRSSGEPFIGRFAQKWLPDATHPEYGQDTFNGIPNNPYSYEFGTIQSDVAEIAYFVRGRTLYRRVLLVKPDFPLMDLELRNGEQDPPNPPLDQLSPRGFYNNDVSIRQEWRYDSSGAAWVVVMAANTLGDLTKPENRFAHQPTVPGTGNAAGFPYHPHWWFDWDWTDPTQFMAKPTFWGTFSAPLGPCVGLGLPTLQECSHPDWWAGGIASLAPPPPPPPYTLPPRLPNSFPLTPYYPGSAYDAWNNPHPYPEQDPDTGSLSLYLGPRVGEDVVLTNVVGFDVKVWDPGALLLPGIDASNGEPISGVALAPGDLGYLLAWNYYTTPSPASSDPKYHPVGRGAYVDLGHGYGTTAFSGPGNFRSRLQRVYDTWSTHYESDWFDIDLDGTTTFESGITEAQRPLLPPFGDQDHDSVIDEGTDGMDSDGNGIVDDAGEQEAPAPYPVPLRGIQIKIRVFEPDSRQVRERTIICDFLPK